MIIKFWRIFRQIKKTKGERLLMKRKVIGIVLALILTSMMLVACAAPAATTPTEPVAESQEATVPEAESAEPAAAEDDQVFVGLAFGGLDAVPTIVMNYLTAKMDALGWKYVVTNGDLDVNKYLADIESLCQQHPDVIMTRVPNDTVNASVVPIIAAAKVPTVFLATATEVPEYKDNPYYLGHISDPELIRGEPLGDWLVKYCQDNNFEPKIGVVNGAKSIDAVGVCERSIDVFAALDKAGIKYEKVADVEADPPWAATGSIKIMEDWIQAYTTDQMNTILCWSDEMVVGVVQALQSAGKSPDDYLVLSYDGLQVVWPYVKEGYVDVSSGLLLEQQADAVIAFIQKYLDGTYDKTKDFQTYCYSIFMLDKTNIDDVMAGKKPATWDYSGLVG
jgi:ABC-type sugar transport system substrate-binding protein